MTYLILKGVLTGLILSIMLGPAFFILIETSIKRGFRAAVSFDAGVLSSDVFYILVAYLFYHELSHVLQGEHVLVMKIVGGVLFIAFGYWMFRSQKTKNDEQELAKDEESVESGEFWKMFIKGFLLNFANPMVILYWLSVISFGIQKSEDYHAFIDPVLIFLAVIVVTFFSVDLLKITAAKSLRSVITPKLMKNLNHFIGIIILGFGFVILFQGLKGILKIFYF